MKSKKVFLNLVAIAAGVVLLAACSETQLTAHWLKKITWPGQQETAGTYKVGKPYRVGSVWYYPQEDFRLAETGIASWYGPNFHGKRTANGERYDQHELTAAHRTLQMPSLVRVTNLENGRAVVVRINDRGPFKHGRVIDLSKRAAELLGFVNKGTARVRLEVLPQESRQMAEAAKRGMDTSRLTLADLGRIDAEATPVRQASAPSQPVLQPVSLSSPEAAQQRVRIASRDMRSDYIPESLQTPTITVEDLSAPPGGRPIYVAPDPAPVATPPQGRREFVSGLNIDEQGAAPGADMAQGRLEEGRFMPAPVVTREAVQPTGIFIQAGAFGVRSNADRLKRSLDPYAQVSIQPVNMSGRTLYRVKLGPLASVDEADRLLERVISLGSDGAKVVRER
jgi:rare lipoprotein A